MKYAKLLYMRYLIAYYVLFIFIAIYHAVKTRDLFNWFSILRKHNPDNGEFTFKGKSHSI
jgi:hypothetical protein